MLMAAICNINIFFHHKKITTIIIIMLCLEDLSSNVLCRKEKSLWPNFLYPWGKHEICRWCGCWNACPLHKHWKGQWGNCSTSCIRWAATSFTVIVPDSCWKVLFGLNQHMSCAPHGQPSHLGCTDEQHTGACSGQWKSGGSNPLCMSLLNFECSLGAFKASLSDLAVSKQCPVSGHTLYAWMWCGVRHGSGSSWLLLLWRKVHDEWHRSCSHSVYPKNHHHWFCSDTIPYWKKISFPSPFQY